MVSTCFESYLGFFQNLGGLMPEHLYMHITNLLQGSGRKRKPREEETVLVTKMERG